QPPAVPRGFDNAMVACDLSGLRRAFGGVGGWTRGWGADVECERRPDDPSCVCILRPSGGSTLAADFLLELRAPIGGGGEAVLIEQDRSHNQTECRANNETRSL